jgi:flagellar biosynthesis protein FlhA
MKTHTIQAETLYTSDEVSEYLHLSQRTIQRLLQAGTLKSYKIHGQYRIKGLDLLTYLDGVRREPELSFESNRPAQVLDLLKVYPVAVELAPDLIALINPETNPEFAPALQELRKAISLALGFVMPGVKLTDNQALAEGQYRMCIQGHQVAKGQLGLSGDGFSDPQSRLLQHLNQVVCQFAHEIISREDVFVMVEALRKDHSVVIEEVLTLDGPQMGKLTIGQLTRILRALLAEQVSLRNLPLILESLADALEAQTPPELWVEKARQGLARQLCEPLANQDGVIQVWGLEPESEAALLEAFNNRDQNLNALSRSLHQQLAQLSGERPVLLCSVELRPRLREMLQRNFEHWTVLSYHEIERYYRVELLGSLAL